MIVSKRAVTSQPINELIARRWSTRAFNSNKNVSREQIISICESARWAPSCSNEQPWRFLVFDKNQDLEAWQKGFDCLTKSNQRWVINAPVLIIALADSQFRKDGTANRWGQFDTGAACMNLYLQAVELGLMAHPMGGFDKEKVSSDFSIPANFTPMAMIAVGYQADAEILDERNKISEFAERIRFPLAENFFNGGWGKTYE
jgi:nitroreductase